jgi:NAD(P)-dependent dehydrogenase (short-subunit alcohol dehydrogenase family)
MVITGASDGIGASAARRLHANGEKVVVVGRSPEKTRAVAAELGVDSYVSDFSELAQVRTLARQLRSTYPTIDVLVNNAGGVASRIDWTPDGYETTLQVNYLAPFLLSTMLMDVLCASRGAVINTSSSAQNLLGRVNADDLLSTHRYRPSKAYALTKLAINLFTAELHRRHNGAGVSTASFHPGWVDSNFGVASGSRLLKLINRTPLHKTGASPDKGAEQLIWLATSDPEIAWTSGHYYVRHRIGRANRQAYDATLARQLWDRTAEMLGG